MDTDLDGLGNQLDGLDLQATGETDAQLSPALQERLDALNKIEALGEKHYKEVMRASLSFE